MSLWQKLFGKKDERADLDPLSDLTLSNLKVGYLVDYDLKTWQVKSQSGYTFDDTKTQEWELDAGDDSFFLEREEDDGVEWNISRKIDFPTLGQSVREHIRQHDDPPEEIEYQGIHFRLVESGAGYYHPNGRVAGDEMIYWDYSDASEDNTLTIEQWGEDEFEAAVGKYVNEYEFSHILPREGGSDS